MFSPPRELPDRAPRLADGRYVLLARIGRGGMAGVYAAWDTRIDEWRAIKVLLPKHARDGGLRARFEREGTTMMALHHPNLCRVFEVGEGEKLPFLVMELINAGSLYRWTKVHGLMPPRMAVETTLQLCAGVTAVHESGVVHRDIKPRNVLINWDGVLKLTDFGIAQLEDSHETRTGLAMGTLGFMSPEQLHDAKSVDLRADIYALGATLWSQLTARKARDLFRLEDKPGLMDGVQPLLRPILAQCLAYDREDRFQSAEELAESLADVLHDLPEDPPDSPPLQLPLESLSLKSKPENTFSEILTTLAGEDENSESEQSADDDRPRPVSSSGATIPPSRSAERPPQSLVDGLPAQRQQTPGKTTPHNTTPQLLDSGSSWSGGDPKLMPPVALRSGGQSLAQRRQMELEHPEELPEYLLGVDQPDNNLKPELITYTPEVVPVPPEPPVKLLGRVLILLMITPVVLLMLLVVLVVSAAGLGAVQVRSAASSVEEARADLAMELTNAQGLLDELPAIGAQQPPLRDAYERWRSTDDPGPRAKAGLAFVHLAEQEMAARVGFDERTHEQALVVQRVERLQASRGRLMEAERDWTTAAETPQGWLAVAVRLAPPPGG
jgi:serine/threonine protein kinase